MLLNNKTSNNAGFSLVELLAVMAISSIILGAVGMGIGLAFSKDATQCATRLDDAIYSARMDTMSKPGEHSLVIKKNAAGNYIAEINCVRPDGTPVTDIVYLEGDSSADKVELITAKLKKSGGASEDLMTETNTEMTITFDTSKGCVKTGAGTAFSQDGIIEFNIKPKKGTNEADVSLITSTGKHTVGKYE